MNLFPVSSSREYPGRDWSQIPDSIDDNTRLQIRLVVGCSDSEGTPLLYPVRLICSGYIYSSGAHYDWARDRAMMDRYGCARSIEIDEVDAGGAEWFELVADWDEVLIWDGYDQPQWRDIGPAGQPRP